MTRRSVPPVWLMGFTNSVYGMYGAFLLISVPQLLSARHVPEPTIATMCAVMVSPGFWTFLVIQRLLPLRFLYLMIGVVGSLFTFALIMLPRTPTVFALAFIGEDVFQGLAITTSVATHSQRPSIVY
jgi:hypothetical protein